MGSIELILMIKIESVLAEKKKGQDMSLVEQVSLLQIDQCQLDEEPALSRCFCFEKNFFEDVGKSFDLKKRGDNKVSWRAVEHRQGGHVIVMSPHSFRIYLGIRVLFLEEQTRLSLSLTQSINQLLTQLYRRGNNLFSPEMAPYAASATATLLSDMSKPFRFALSFRAPHRFAHVNAHVQLQGSPSIPCSGRIGTRQKCMGGMQVRFSSRRNTVNEPLVCLSITSAIFAHHLEAVLLSGFKYRARGVSR